MLTKLLSTPTISICFFLFTSFQSSGQETIRFKTQQASAKEDLILKGQFKAYTLATLGTEKISKLLRAKDYYQDLRLEVDGKSFSFNLRARDIRSANYKLRAQTDQGVIELPRSPNKTYFGFTHTGHFDVRITADEDFFHAMIIQQNDELYIEPARDIIPGAAINQFVIYWASDNLKKLSNSDCGTHSVPNSFLTPEEGNLESQQNEFSGRACKTVQIALGDDHFMFDDYGSVSAVEDHNMAVINDVETNYDFEFADDLQFSIVEIYVATTAGNDPWCSTCDIFGFLDDFTDWGPTGFSNTHDVAGCWSGRNFPGDVIGVAWLSAVCTSFRYHVMEDFSTNANLLRVMQAHEMGHNFSANHDAPNSGFIMAPSVTNTNTWSSASISSIDNYINQINCLGPCAAPAPPGADFDATPTNGCTPLVVNFDDQSTNTPTTWNWTFQGGTPGTSTNQNPTITYNSSGSFNVTLLVSNNFGSNSVTYSNFITVGDDPFADFDYEINEFEVDFQNSSDNATSYFWTFGDGGTSTQTNPLHTYPEDGVYTVTLTATNSCGSDVFTQVIEIITLPNAAFSSDITEGCDPFEVEFINLSSTNAQTFSWSFPGGTPSTSLNYQPIILYENPGTYNVSLTAYNEAGEDVQTITNYITVNPQPAAEFSFTTNGLQATFNSTGSIGTNYSWEFGDGEDSNAPNPIHIYNQAGTYQVVLTVSNECGTDFYQLNVTVVGTPTAAFISNTQYGCAPLVVQFTNTSGGSPTSYSWVFQGGIPATSTQANPLVTYNTPGLFDVQLTVMNNAGNDILLLDDYIEVEYPTASDFNFSVNGVQATFVNQSFNSTGSAWDFGDGFLSTETNPIHNYLMDGAYTVTLISAGVCGNDTSTSQVIIQTPPQAGFSFQQMSECVPANVNFFNESSSNATSFAWSFPGGNPSTSTLPNPSVTYVAAGTYAVTLIAYSAVGSDTLYWTDLFSVGIAPDASFLLSTDQMTVAFDNQSTNADGYLWSFGDGQTSTEQSPTHTYAAFGTYVVSLIAVNECGIDTMEIVIVLSTIPNAFFTYSAHTGCAPFEVTFIDQSQNNPTSWAWSFEGGDPSTSDLQNPTVLYLIPGAHTVSLQVSNSQGTDVIILDGIIQVGGTPDASFLHVQNENIISLEYPGVDYDSLRWSFGDGRTDNSLNPTVEYTISGEYQISLIAYNACGSDTSSIWVTIVITSTNNPVYTNAGWQVRPNPFNAILTIYGEPTTEGILTLSLLDVHGRLISTEEWIYSPVNATKEIVADHLPSGIILVVIQDQSSRVVLKAVHQ